MEAEIVGQPPVQMNAVHEAASTCSPEQSYYEYLNDWIASLSQSIQEHLEAAKQYQECCDEVRKNRDASMNRMLSIFTDHMRDWVPDFCDKPELPWEDRFESQEFPGVLSIDPEDLSAPIMRGRTPDGRIFIAFKLHVGDQIVAEIFFPYSNEDRATWIGSSYYGSNRPVEETLFFASGQAGLGVEDRHAHVPAIKVNEIVIKRLKELVQGKTLNLEEPKWDAFEYRKGPPISLAK